MTRLGRPEQAYTRTTPADTTHAGQAGKIRGSLGADFRLSGGNIRQALLKVNANLFLERKNLLVNPHFLFTQNTIFGNKLEADVFTYVLLKGWHHRRLCPVAAGLYENSVIRSIDRRWLGGAGPAWKAVAARAATLELIQLIVYDKTAFGINEALGYAGLRTHTSLTGTYALLKNRLYFEHRLFFSVLLRDPGNYRLRTFATLRVPLSKKFSLTGNLDYLYESIVDERRAPGNYTSTGGLSFSF
jgi:hypothetical protein